MFQESLYRFSVKFRIRSRDVVRNVIVAVTA
jgi:hypothetical protein